MTSCSAAIWLPRVDALAYLGRAAVEGDLREPALRHEAGNPILLAARHGLADGQHLVLEAGLDPVVLIVGKLDVAGERAPIDGGGGRAISVDAGRNHVADEEVRVLSRGGGQMSE